MAPTDAAAGVLLGHADIGDALLLSDEARWNQTADDWAVFVDHGECYGVRAGGRLVASAAILPFSGGFGWVSMVLVTSDWRRRGLASRLMNRCVEALRARGCAALLDATPEGALVYGQLGFRSQCGMARWRGAGSGPGPIIPPVVSVALGLEGLRSPSPLPSPRNDGERAASALELPPSPRSSRGEGPAGDEGRRDRLVIRPEVLARDLQVFGGDRRFLLDAFHRRPGTVLLGDGGNFVMLRKGRRATQIGPLIAGSDAEARDLLQAALATVSGPVILDVLDAGAGLNAVLEKHGFEAFRSFQRMALDRPDLPGEPAALMVAAGPEFG